MPVDSKYEHFQTAKSFDLKRNASNITFSKEFQKLHPEIPPPRPRDLVNKKIMPVEESKFLRDCLSVSDIPGAQVK